MVLRNKPFIFMFLATLSMLAITWLPQPQAPKMVVASDNQMIDLPSPEQDSETSLEAVLANRTSIRKYADVPLSMQEVSQLLWAAQGISDRENEIRTAPSAGGLYPMKIYVAIKNVNGLKSGVYSYIPKKHSLRLLTGNTVHKKLAVSAQEQMFISQAPALFVVSADYSETIQKYDTKGIRYVQMEAGHIAQNIYLQAESLGLGTVCVGRFHDKKVDNALKLLPQDQSPLYIMPVGKPKN